MKKVAISQSNYLPWIGYFDLINSVDEFVLYDDAQYTKRDWRNRNRIKTENGIRWLSVPVYTKGKFDQKIKDTKIEDVGWCVNHWKIIAQAYRKAEHYDVLENLLAPIYLETKWISLTELNLALIKVFCDFLKISTTISTSMDYSLQENDATAKLVELSQHARASEYVTGPAAQDYLNTSLFSACGIRVTYFKYPEYPEYPQLFPPFAARLSIIDTVANLGAQSRNFLNHHSPFSTADSLNHLGNND